MNHKSVSPICFAVLSLANILIILLLDVGDLSGWVVGTFIMVINYVAAAVIAHIINNHIRRTYTR